MNGMDKILLDMEKMNLEWARRRVRSVRNMQKGMFWQAGFFLFLGTAFTAWFTLGGSWWNLFSVAIYFGGGLFFLHMARTKYALMVWSALRKEAVCKNRLREMTERLR